MQDPRSIDYQELGLTAGLEVHQQLLTDNKMFCHCPAGRYTETHDGEVLRHMRPTLSELGEYDGTALMEFRTRKNIIYLLNKENVCTYEMDDTPPFLINQQAIDIAIEQCLMLGCDIIDEVHIARKQYLDGSIPTGFQRTAIVGVNGRLPFRGREISITQVSVEEDSCREVSDCGHLIVWRTDRLGMPLIETVTGPDLRTPEEVEEAILLIGRVCRSTGHVRVGIGASRQDVNVSIRGGRRVEIKGVSQARQARKLVHCEAVRQMNLLRLRDELHRRGVRSAADLRIDSVDVTDIFASCALETLRAESWERCVAHTGRRVGLELLPGPFCVRAVLLKGLAGTLSRPTQAGLTFAAELAGRVRVIAGLDQAPILYHDEEWPDYPGSAADLRRLRARLRCDPGDAVAIVWGVERDTVTAMEEIRTRFVDALDGVPNETRQPFADGRTDFERILPGPDRMYPDTDSPPSLITRERVERLRRDLAPRPWEREARYAAVGVPTSTIHYLIRRNGASLVDRVVASCGADLRAACFLLGERLKGLRRAGVPVTSISDDRWCELFQAMRSRPPLREAWEIIVRRMAGAPSMSVTEILSADGLGEAPEGWLDLVPQQTEAALRELNGGDTERLRRLAMGRCMAILRGKVAARDVAAALDDNLLARSPHGRG